MFRLFRRQRGKEEPDDLTGRLITVLDPYAKASEAYRTLRTNLFYSVVDTPPKVIVLTSHAPREGKSTTCANLGVVLAQADKRTLIVDCDLRRPVIHKVFDLRNIDGLTNVLTGERELPEVWREPLKNLTVLTVGPIPLNPAEVLGSRRFSQFLDRVRREFDYVLLDAPPTHLVSDPMVLASQGDGVLLVLDAQNTGKGAVRKSLRSLEAVGANILGTVMNNQEGSNVGGYYRYTY
jgi:receptor protein-tyrosine kinase